MLTNSFEEYVENADLSNDEVYANFVRKVMEVFNLSPLEVADELRVSVPIVKRWANGVTAPHPMIREPIRRLAKALLAR